MQRARFHRSLWLGLIAVLCIGGVSRAQQAVIGVQPEQNALNQQLTELRQELATTRLKLETALAELEKLKAFLAEKDLDQRLEEWRQERRLLQQERTRLQLERARIERLNRKLGQNVQLNNQREREALEKEKHELAKAVKPNWSIQYMLGYIRTDTDEIRYYNVSDGRVYTQRRFDTIDRRNVKVKGTVLNRSEAPWRYTFEIRLGGEGIDPFRGGSTIMGKWRIQTPLLGPGDLHEFEVTIPVQNATAVEVVQVGNLVADQPAQFQQVGNPPAQVPVHRSHQDDGRGESPAS